jgi:hypothetical protein
VGSLVIDRSHIFGGVLGLGRCVPSRYSKGGVSWLTQINIEVGPSLMSLLEKDFYGRDFSPILFTESHYPSLTEQHERNLWRGEDAK